MSTSKSFFAGATTLLVALTCLRPAHAQTGAAQAILTGTLLGSGLAINLNTSDGRSDWLSNDGTSLVMKYPGQSSQFGFVFITVGPSVPPGNRPGRDFSAFQTLILEMKGDAGSLVDVGIKDSTQPDDGTEARVTLQLSSDWRTYYVPLTKFVGVDLTRVYVVTEFVFNGTQARSAQVRNITYSSMPPLVTQLLPQLAFGGGWYSALYFTNTGGLPASVQLSFIGDDGKSLNVGALGTGSTLNLNPGATGFVEAPNIGALVQGYVSIGMPDGVAGYGIFRQSVTGQPDQEAVVPLSLASNSTSTLIWDETNFVTGVAIVNPNPQDGTVNIVARDSSGQIIGTSSLPLVSGGKTAVVLRNLPGLNALAGQRGSADFTLSSGSIAVLGLRFNGTAFTSIPTADR